MEKVDKFIYWFLTRQPTEKVVYIIFVVLTGVVACNVISVVVRLALSLIGVSG